MKKIRKVFCTLVCHLNIDGCFIPKGTKVQLFKMVDIIENNGHVYKKIRVRCCDYLMSEEFQANVGIVEKQQWNTHCAYATSGEPIFFDVESSYLEFDSSVVLNLES